LKSDRIKNWPKQERLREKLLAEGAEKQTDANLLAVILRVGRGTFKKGEPGQSAQALAHALLDEFSGLKGLDRATVQDLLAAPGLSDAKVAQIKAALELGKRVCKRKLNAVSVLSSQAIADRFRPRFTGTRQEIVSAVFLDGQNKILGEKEITEGTPTQATVYIREIFDYPVFTAAPDAVGITSTGAEGPNRLPGVLAAYRKFADWVQRGAKQENIPAFRDGEA
jgi:DNA repair protein RadC